MERETPARLLVSPSLVAPIAAAEELRLMAADCGLGPYHFGLAPVPATDPAGFLYLVEELSGKRRCLAAAMDDQILKLKAPKLEPAEDGGGAWFSSKGISPGFHRLPQLCSIEPSPDQSPELPRPVGDLASLIESSHKRLRSPPRASSPPTPTPPPPPPPPPPPYGSCFGFGKPVGPSVLVPTSEISRRRRQRISDRTRILEGLMPWGRRMDTATMLEEARKYVRFLEAQVTALQSMPPSASEIAPHQPPSPSALGRGVGGGLEGLSRQQLLRVLVGSAPVQDVLYRKGWCVFSAEQVAALRRAVERRPQLLLLLDGSTSR